MFSILGIEIQVSLEGKIERKHMKLWGEESCHHTQNSLEPKGRMLLPRMPLGNERRRGDQLRLGDETNPASIQKDQSAPRTA